MARKPKQDWKDRLGVVYSTNDAYNFDHDSTKEQKTLGSDKQILHVSLDKKQRRGKQVTLVTGFIGLERDLKELGKVLKSKCGVGGSAKNGEIIIQGDFTLRIKEILQHSGYRTR